MSKKLFVIALVSVALIFSGVVSAVAETMTWKVVGLSRPTPQFKPWEWFAAELEKRTKGQIKVNLVSLPELGLTGFELVRVIKAGLVDVGDVLPTYVAGDVPMIEGVDLVGLFPDFDTSVKAHESFMPVLSKYLAKVSGGVVIGVYYWPHQVLWSRKEVRTLDDLKGMKIRVYGTAQTQFLKALGAVPVSIAFAEVYTALERGTVDGGITGTYSGYALKWYEVSKYQIEMNLGPVIGTLTVSKKTWDKLTPELKATLKQLGKEFTVRGTEVGRRTSQEGIDESAKKGIKYVNLGPKFLAGTRKAVISAVIPGWVKRAGPEAKPVFNKYIAPYAGYKIP
ncbi:MAG: TRAP transporter substrate-binding protein [Candidatus Methylomirabilales bacterium]